MAFQANRGATRRATVNLNIVTRSINFLNAADQTTWEQALFAHIQVTARTDGRVGAAAYVAGVVPTQAQFNTVLYALLLHICQQGTSPQADYTNVAITCAGTDPTNPANVAHADTTSEELFELFEANLPNKTIRQLVRTYATGIYHTAKSNNVIFQWGFLHHCNIPAVGFDCSEYIDPAVLTRLERRYIAKLKQHAIYQSIIDEDIAHLRQEGDEITEEAESSTSAALFSTKTRGHRRNISSVTLVDRS